MAQYTRCVEFDDFKSHWQGSSQGAVAPLFFNAFTKAFVYMIVGALAGAGIGALAGDGIGAVIGAAGGAYIGFSYGFVEGFCDQWLNWRLICVKRDQCAGGHVAWIETMEAKFGHDPIEWLFDNDLSFNIRLLPYSGKKQAGSDALEFDRNDTSVTYGLDRIAADPFPAAEVLRKPRKSDGTDWDLAYTGYEDGAKPDHPGGRWTLHSEIEGNGMQTLCTIAKVLSILGPATAALGVVAGAVGSAIYGAVKGYQWAHDGCKKACGIPILCDVVCVIAGIVVGAIAAFIGANLGAIAGAIPGLSQVIIGGLISTIIRHNGQLTDVATRSGFRPHRGRGLRVRPRRRGLRRRPRGRLGRDPSREAPAEGHRAVPGRRNGFGGVQADPVRLGGEDVLGSLVHRAREGARSGDQGGSGGPDEHVVRPSARRRLPRGRAAARR
jgi:hypothetical protein